MFPHNSCSPPLRLLVNVFLLTQTFWLSLHQHKPHNHNISVHSILYSGHKLNSWHSKRRPPTEARINASASNKHKWIIYCLFIVQSMLGPTGRLLQCRVLAMLIWSISPLVFDRMPQNCVHTFVVLRGCLLTYLTFSATMVDICCFELGSQLLNGLSCNLIQTLGAAVAQKEQRVLH